MTSVMNTISDAASIPRPVRTSIAPIQRISTAIDIPITSVSGCESADTRLMRTIPSEYRWLASPNRWSS